MRYSVRVAHVYGTCAYVYRLGRGAGRSDTCARGGAGGQRPAAESTCSPRGRRQVMGGTRVGARSWGAHVCIAGGLAESTCTAGGLAESTWQREAVAEWRVHVGVVGGDL